MSKTIKQITLLGLLFILSAFTGKETKTIQIKTSTVCDMCKQRIERELVFEKGIKQVTVDLKTNTIDVVYRPEKITPDAIRKAVSKLGYQADDIPADEAGFKKLPECCQKDGCGKK